MELDGIYLYRGSRVWPPMGMGSASSRLDKSRLCSSPHLNGNPKGPRWCYTNW